MSTPKVTGSLPGPGSLLFVYGTLQRGGEYHYILEQVGATFVSSGKTATPYPLILAAYPCLLDLPNKGYQVKGEVYRLDKPSDWIPIDQLEAHPVEYRRRPEPIQTASKTLQAWTYFYIQGNFPTENLSPVPGFPVTG